MSSSDRVTQLHPQTKNVIIVSFKDSQDYGEGILTRRHTEQRRNIHYEISIYHCYRFYLAVLALLR
jgi:hypothetical protein